MNKYDPLGNFLKEQSTGQVSMTFAAVERLLGTKLPRSAREHRPWWANDATGHSHARAWLEAGFVTEQVDMVAEKLVFRRVKIVEAGGMAEASEKFEGATKQHPMIGALKGLLWIDPTLDLTKPALDSEEWEEILAAKYGKDGREA